MMMLMMMIKELFHAKDVQKARIDEKEDKRRKTQEGEKNNGDDDNDDGGGGSDGGGIDDAMMITRLKVIPWFCTAHLLLRITRWPP